MLIHVRLLQYAKKTFTYSVPSDLQSKMVPGVFVQVPLQQRIIPAVVQAIADETASYDFEVKSIKSVYPFPEDVHYNQFIDRVSQYYQVDELHFFRRVQKFLQEKEKSVELAMHNFDIEPCKEVTLTSEQKEVCEQVFPYIKQNQQKTFVLHGVTGSGKTEVYKKLIQEVLLKNKSVFLLLPEITLALQFEKIIQKSFTQHVIIGFHSATTIKQKRLLWKMLLENKPVIIIGVHLPILLPVSNLGLIIVDEEHDAGYQEKKHPKVHSRDMAILKAVMYNVPIVLGSATPSLQSLCNVQRYDWKLLTLKQRFAGSFPKVKMVSLKEKEKRKHFWITQELYYKIKQRLEHKEQVIIFLNRRGYSFFVQCSCSFVFECQKCSVSLTLHQDGYLVCHYCGYKEEVKKRCPSCNGWHEEFIKKGIGTQQLTQVLQRLFPQATVARADADTTVKKRSWQQTVSDMLHGDIDILVGTQSITKGYHFPKVTLVGVLWADLNLHFPIYNAAETTLQQLIQVAGRAGRQSEHSEVIVQAFDQHPVFDHVSEVQYMQFCTQEMQKRKEVGYPPYKHIAEIEVRHKDQQVVEKEASVLKKLLQENIAEELQVEVLGPVQAVVYRVKDVFAQKIVLKSFSRKQLVYVFHNAPKDCYVSSIFFTIDPVS